MDEVTVKTFYAIQNLLHELTSLFSSDSHLKLYDRLVSHHISVNNPDHAEDIQTHVTLFEKFVTKHKNAVLGKEAFPSSARIVYSERVFVDVYAIMRSLAQSKMNAEHDAVLNHLATILALLHPDEDTLSMLEKKSGLKLDIDSSTKEGEFLTSMMSECHSAMEGVQPGNFDGAFSAIASSGMFEKLFTGLQGGAESGEMNMENLFGVVMGAMDGLRSQLQAAQAPSPPQIVELKEETSSATTPESTPESTSTQESTSTPEESISEEVCKEEVCPVKLSKNARKKAARHARQKEGSVTFLHEEDEEGVTLL